MQALLAVIAFGAVLGIARAQESLPTGSTLSTSKPTASASQGKGFAVILVSRDGEPAAGVAVRGLFGERRTDSEGAVSVELPAGANQMTVEGLEAAFQFDVRARSETQVRVRLLSDAEGSAEQRAPEDFQVEAAPELSAAQGHELVLRVLDDESSKPISAALILVSGFRGQLETSPEGRVSLRLPEGERTILVSHPSAETKTLKISATGAPSELEVRLKAASAALEEVLVLAPKNKGSVSALIEVRRQTNAVAEVLGSEQMSRQGDSDAAASLRRVTGLTLVGGKYVYVRGLGERYSGVQMNGLGLPSPEPAKRVVPLDLFPTAVLESVLVQKSYSADLPGEFGGGLIQLRTRSLPEKAFFRLGVSMNLEAIDPRLNDPQGDGNFLAQGGAGRQLPSAVRDALASGRRINENAPPTFTNGFDPAELQALGRSFSDTYDPSRTESTLPPGLNIAMGNRWHFEKGWSAGAAGSIMTSASANAFERETARVNVGGGNQLVRGEEATIEESEVERKAGATVDFGLDMGADHRLIVTAMALRDSAGNIEVKNSTTPGDSVDARRKTMLEWIERDLLVRQVQGSHRFPTLAGVTLDWRAGSSEAKRNAPDTREYVYLLQDGEYGFNPDTTGNRRIFSELSDQSNEIAMDLSMPVPTTILGEVKLKTGFNRFAKDRQSDVFRFHFKNKFHVGQAPDFTAPADVVLGQENIRPDGFVLTNLTDSADSYGAMQRTESLYGQVEWSPAPSWTLVSGLRREISVQEVRTYFYDKRETPDSMASLRTDDFLPAHSLTWKPNDSWRARFAYSETLARPDFRELSTVPFIDDESGLEVVGNSRLRGTVIRNFDHRWEYYFNPDEFLSAGVFMKHFEAPIEEVFEPSPNLRKTFDNAESAQNMGFEFETRFSLRRVSRDLRFWTQSVNVSLIDSRITLAERSLGVQTTADRPLQGQSPYVVNLQLQYDRPQRGLTATALYNIIGPRITEVGTNLRPDVYEEPFQQLDLVASQKLGTNTNLGVRLRNLLDPEAVSLQGGEVVRRFRKGAAFSVGLTMTL